MNSFFTFAAKGTLSEDTIRLFLRQLGKIIMNSYKIFSTVYRFFVNDMTNFNQCVKKDK